MASRPRQKRQDDSTRTQAAPVAEAIAIGTAAGGLVIGTMQATATEAAIAPALNAGPSLDRNDVGATGGAVSADVEPASRPSEAPASQANEIAQPATTLASPVQQEPTEEPTEAPAPAFSTAGPAAAVEAASHTPAADMDTVVANTIPLPVQTQLVADLSEQITSTLIKVIGNAEGGLPVSDFGQAIASDIVQSAQHIVAGIAIQPMLDGGTLTEEIVQTLDAPGIVDDVLAATSGIADSVLADVSGLPASILGATTELSSLPSALLGNNGPEDTGGLLSTLFYPDGASDELSMPDLSDAAGSLVSDLGGVTVGMLGISYVDVPDHSGPSLGINALGLL